MASPSKIPPSEQTLSAPRPFLSLLPGPIAHFLGYRPSKPTPRSQPIVWLWSFLGAFCSLFLGLHILKILKNVQSGGLSVIQAVFVQAQYFVKRGAPSIVPSYGASAVLIYGAIEAPLAQPQALVFGHFVGGLVGVIITKLFLLLPSQEKFDHVSWVAVSLSCAAAIVAMQMTKTVHPPAGATAILPALDPSIRALGWYFLPVLLLSSTLALMVSLLFNNIQRRYPTVWYTPLDLPSLPKKKAVTENGDAELDVKDVKDVKESTTASAETVGVLAQAA
ncbi:hypothetical protein GYMLUDRAFT_62524 [Collybiopsis luxurians FD-317 M1]|uniref:HPP transmembrane region domain-containing protein n=1 Tax=Collybiopsis luxurians FD-317 M1 TaxID=944289 RepID=A0A0D0CC00_9AGAR|nr:hypothetical protein GYMLUDRAFT_62524 [Collybiopsis luxurians FD-317 M1]